MPGATPGMLYGASGQPLTRPARLRCLGFRRRHSAIIALATTRGPEASMPVTLQAAGPYIGMSRFVLAFAPNRRQCNQQNAAGSRIYEFEWRVDIGPWCAFHPGNATRSSGSEWQSGHIINKGKFNVTIAADAPVPSITTKTCGYFAGAVSYASTTTWIGDWQTQHNNFICVETADVTQTAPCSATIDAQLAQNVSEIMGWTSAAATGSRSSSTQATTPTTTGPPSSSSTSAAAGSWVTRPNRGWAIVFILGPFGIWLM